MRSRWEKDLPKTSLAVSSRGARPRQAPSLPTCVSGSYSQRGSRAPNRASQKHHLCRQHSHTGNSQPTTPLSPFGTCQPICRCKWGFLQLNKLPTNILHIQLMEGSWKVRLLWCIWHIHIWLHPCGISQGRSFCYWCSLSSSGHKITAKHQCFPQEKKKKYFFQSIEKVTMDRTATCVSILLWLILFPGQALPWRMVQWGIQQVCARAAVGCAAEHQSALWSRH